MPNGKAKSAGSKAKTRKQKSNPRSQSIKNNLSKLMKNIKRKMKSASSRKSSKAFQKYQTTSSSASSKPKSKTRKLTVRTKIPSPEVDEVQYLQHQLTRKRKPRTWTTSSPETNKYLEILRKLQKERFLPKKFFPDQEYLSFAIAELNEINNYIEFMDALNEIESKYSYQFSSNENQQFGEKMEMEMYPLKKPLYEAYYNREIFNGVEMIKPKTHPNYSDYPKKKKNYYEYTSDNGIKYVIWDNRLLLAESLPHMVKGQNMFGYIGTLMSSLFGI